MPIENIFNFKRDSIIEHEKLINEKRKIEKKLTTLLKKIYTKEQTAIDYAKACGCNWLAKDQNGDICAYKEKPYKLVYTWTSGLDSYCILINMDLSFLSWNDKEPYYIGD